MRLVAFLSCSNKGLGLANVVCWLWKQCNGRVGRNAFDLGDCANISTAWVAVCVLLRACYTGDSSCTIRARLLCSCSWQFGNSDIDLQTVFGCWQVDMFTQARPQVWRILVIAIVHTDLRKKVFSWPLCAEVWRVCRSPAQTSCTVFLALSHVFRTVSKGTLKRVVNTCLNVTGSRLRVQALLEGLRVLLVNLRAF